MQLQLIVVEITWVAFNGCNSLHHQRDFHVLTIRPESTATSWTWHWSRSARTSCGRRWGPRSCPPSWYPPSRGFESSYKLRVSDQTHCSRARRPRPARDADQHRLMTTDARGNILTVPRTWVSVRRRVGNLFRLRMPSKSRFWSESSKRLGFCSAESGFLSVPISCASEGVKFAPGNPAVR